MKKAFLPSYLIYLFWISCILLLLFTSCRLVLIWQNHSLLTQVPNADLLYALFNRGMLFDASIISYVIAPLFLILGFLNLTQFNLPYLKKASGFFTFIITITSLMMVCADLPYFQYYNARLTNAVFALTANDSTSLILLDLFTNPIYLPFSIAFIIGSILLWFAIKKLTQRFLLTSFIPNKLPFRITAFIVAGYLIFSGLRGDINPDNIPLKIEHAYFSENTIVNQLGLNAAYSFMDSYRDSKLKYLNDEDAIANTRKYLQINSNGLSPLARVENRDSTSKGLNVVLVLVESLSTSKMKRFGNPTNLMPFLDSLYDHSLSFNKIYTAGMHTHNGIFSTLTGLPSVLNNTPMLSATTTSKPFAGLAVTLKKNNYNTLFFMTGKKNFDNMQGFLPLNGFDELISKMNYPKEQWINRWGVPDHCMYDYSIKKLDSLAELGRPFFSTFMTVSTHNPYSVPGNVGFNGQAKNVIDLSYEYTDWSIRRFINNVKSKSWFENTIFIFTGDHGQNFDPIYDIPLAYHHTPLLYYCPKTIQPEIIDKLGLQIDIYPTLMGIMGIPYVNNTLGINLKDKQRPFAYFTTDDKIGCLNDSFYLVMNKGDNEHLYRYQEKSVVDLLEQNSKLVAQMKNYTYSMLQTTQWMIDHRKTEPQEINTVTQP